MQEILILGRGGQGAQTAGNQLARAMFAEGLFVQVFATYGGARRGTPVTSSLRADSRPVRLRCNIERAGALLCFDDSLLDANFLQFADESSLIVVNSARPAEYFTQFEGYRIRPVDAKAIAARAGLGKVVNSALLGALVAQMGSPSIDSMCDVIKATAPARQMENVAACREACDLFSNTGLEVLT
jgi:2-oxoacid:acceptor oxidoreductase gamma subunit (pyruvate/2-ketoisovalerate family)